MAENQIQLTAVIKLSKAIATSGTCQHEWDGLGLKRRTKAYPTALVEAVVGDWERIDFELLDLSPSVKFARLADCADGVVQVSLLVFLVEGMLVVQEPERGGLVCVHMRDDEETIRRLFANCWVLRAGVTGRFSQRRGPYVTVTPDRWTKALGKAGTMQTTQQLSPDKPFSLPDDWPLQETGTSGRSIPEAAKAQSPNAKTSRIMLSKC
jgi:hypothetical protein